MGIFRSHSILGIWDLWNMWLDPWEKDFKTVGLLSIQFFTQEGKKKWSQVTCLIVLSAGTPGKLTNDIC